MRAVYNVRHFRLQHGRCLSFKIQKNLREHPGHVSILYAPRPWFRRAYMALPPAQNSPFARNTRRGAENLRSIRKSHPVRYGYPLPEGYTRNTPQALYQAGFLDRFPPYSKPTFAFRLGGYFRAGSKVMERFRRWKPMFASVISVAGVIQGAASVVTVLFLLVSMARSGAASREEIERAEMRSMSWPAAHASGTKA